MSAIADESTESTEPLGLADFLEMFVRVLRADAHQHHYGPDPWERAPEHALVLDHDRAEFLLDEADRADAALVVLVPQLEVS